MNGCHHVNYQQNSYLTVIVRDARLCPIENSYLEQEILYNYMFCLYKNFNNSIIITIL